MNQEKMKPGVGRTLVGCLLAVLLALVAPLMVMTELLSLMMLVLLPSIGVVFLYRWAGRFPAMLCGALQLVTTAMYLGGTFMWIAFFMMLMPLVLLFRSEQKPFFAQMRVTIAGFGAGVLVSVLLLYFSYGGNMIERVLLELPAAMRELPAESVRTISESVLLARGSEMTVEEFYTLFDQMIAQLIPFYQQNLPGLIFSGALLTAVICAGLNAWMRHRRGLDAPGSYLPLREWALPASTTGGLLLIVAVSYVLDLLGMRNAETLFYTVYSIAVTAFSIQAVTSIARRMHASMARRGAKVFTVIGVALLCLLGGAGILALYGCASAILGSRGALRQRMKNRDDNDSRNGGEE